MINLSFCKPFSRGRLLLAPVVVASLVMSGSAWAQEPLQLRTDVSGTRDFRYELGVVAGGQFFDSEHTLSRADSDPPELSPANAGAFGLQFAVNLHRFISVEAEGLATRTNTRDFSTDMWIFQLGGQLRLHTTNLADRFQPYLLLGYGAIASLVEDQMVQPDDQDGMGRRGRRPAHRFDRAGGAAPRGAGPDLDGFCVGSCSRSGTRPPTAGPTFWGSPAFRSTSAPPGPDCSWPTRWC